MKLKRILIIAGEYPPFSTPCAFRMHSFAKYLEERGWISTVLALEPQQDIYTESSYFGSNVLNYEVQDEIRVKRFPLKSNFHLPSLNRLLGSKCGIGFYSRQYEKFCREELAGHDYSAILATHPGLGVSLRTAVRMGRTFNIPVVCDFRDLADQYSSRKKISFRGLDTWKKKLAALTQDLASKSLTRYEAKMAKSASLCTTVSAGLAKKLDDLGSKRTEVIINGFDQDLYEDAIPRKNSKFTIIYTGAMHWDQDPHAFFDALEILENKRIINNENFSVEFYGVNQTHAKIFGLPSRKYILYSDRIRKEKVIEAAMGADILLHFSHRNTKGVMTSKLTEYLASQRPVLSVPGDGDVVDRFLEECGIGQAIKEASDIAGWIESKLHSWETGVICSNVNTPKEQISQYSRCEQAFRLAGFLDDLPKNKF